MRPKYLISLLGLLAACQFARAQDREQLPGTKPLTLTGDLSAAMVSGIDQFLMRETAKSEAGRAANWHRDLSSPETYARSVQTNRERFRRILGAVDLRAAAVMEGVFDLGLPQKEGRNQLYTVAPVRWTVLEGVHGEGLLLRPLKPPVAHVIAIPDADQTPEMLTGLQPGLPPEAQFARRLAEQGCQVIVPVLIDRADTHSGNPKLGRFTNQPHREWIYRQAFEMGRHVLGYEVQKVLALVDWLAAQDGGAKASPIGVAGYGEGGLVALYSAALDTRLQAAFVSAAFSPRESLWEEPIYRNLFGLLREFGDAEIASLVAPRRLVVEYSEPPLVAGPPPSRQGRAGAAPGKIVCPEFNTVENEARRARALVPGLAREPFLELVNGAEGAAVTPGSEKSLLLFLDGLGVKLKQLALGEKPPPLDVTSEKTAERQRRQIRELERFTQQLFQDSERVRDRLTWDRLKGSNTDLEAICKENREILWRDVIGRMPRPEMPLSPRSRRFADHEKWTGYEVMLDVASDVFAWGYLLVPKGLAAGERRPVVVCQHGLEGLPEDVVTADPNTAAFKAYQAYAARLAERGFVVYAPHNPYRGADHFRVLQRKANPLGLSLFSIIIAQHDATLDWLAAQPFVDPARIGFYGLSYGGKTAMRVPAILPRYALSICSADFNEWVRKNVTVDSPYSYLFTGEYEMVEWNLGHTFNYAEMAALIAPRPFMVERGHSDGVAPDSWVASEFAKVRRLYDTLGIPDRVEIEIFNGPHRINGVGTFQFLHKHLNWPEPKPGR